MRYYPFRCLIVLAIALSACVTPPDDKTAEESSSNWSRDWVLEEGFTIQADAAGFHLPTALAFVPNPGNEPKSPLYFVTELEGRVRVVTNDRTVYTFAENFFRRLSPEEKLPSGEAQTGMAGICLEPKRGYVFVTFAYLDSLGILRNNVVRFQAKPQTFSLQPTSHVAFTEIFLAYETGLAHQIGSCQITDELLYIGVGDAWQPHLSQDIRAMHGKIIRMTLDGKPVPNNPFYQDEDVSKAVNYVWSYGLRNPFSLVVAQDQLFSFDNGHDIDRFMQVHKGENYLWAGADWSIGTNADFVLVPSLGPAQMDYLPSDASVFPEEYANMIYVAVAGEVISGKKPGILMLKYAFGENKLQRVPELFVKYRGNAYQIIAALAFGPDALYFAPLLPDERGTSSILKITSAPERSVSRTLIQVEGPGNLMLQRGCFGCHTFNGDWGRGGTEAPPLDNTGALAARIRNRVTSEQYISRLKALNESGAGPPLAAKARVEVLEAEGEERVRTWIKHQILHPRFDNPYSRMPDLGISESEASIIADYLVQTDWINRLRVNVRTVIPESLLPDIPRRKHLFYYLVVGFFAGIVVALGGGLGVRLLARRKRR